MMRTSPWLASVVMTTGVAGLGVTGVVLAAGAVHDLSRTPTDLDSAVAGAAGLLLGALLLVWSAGSAAAVAAVLVGTAGRTGAALRVVADATTPLLLRRLLAAALGAAVLGGVAGPALAAERTAATPPAGAAAPTSASALTWPAARGTATPTSSRPATSPPPTSTAPTSPPPAATSTSTPISSSGNATRNPVDAPAGAPARTSVVVRPGDSLWSIAASHLPPGSTRAAVAAAWPRWYEANRATIGADPDHLRPGQRLVAP